MNAKDREEVRQTLEELPKIKIELSILQKELDDIQACNNRLSAHDIPINSQIRQNCNSIAQEIRQEIKAKEKVRQNVLDAIDAMQETARGDWWLSEYLYYRYEEGVTHEKASRLLGLSDDYTKHRSARALQMFAKAWKEKQEEQLKLV